MIIDLRKNYISNQLETNMHLLCDENYRLLQFSFNNMKYKIPSYNRKKEGIYIYYFNNIIILPTSLTVRKL